MTKRRAERLTGYEIRELPPERGLIAVGAFEGDRLVVKGLGRAEIGRASCRERVYLCV